MKKNYTGWLVLIGVLTGCGGAPFEAGVVTQGDGATKIQEDAGELEPDSGSIKVEQDAGEVDSGPIKVQTDAGDAPISRDDAGNCGGCQESPTAANYQNTCFEGHTNDHCGYSGTVCQKCTGGATCGTFGGNSTQWFCGIADGGF
jgi:hypothetical protein